MSLSKSEDPSIRFLRSGFGKQVKSESQSEPAYGFGTSHRDTHSKMYVSPELAKTMQGNNSQGAVYRSYGALGPQPDSKYPSAPAQCFGISSRTTKDGRNYPGPGAYDQEGGIGPMKESRRSTSPRTVFGSATRDKQSKVWLDEEMMKTYCGQGTPGPCSYATPGGLGKQTDSRHYTEPAWRQGTAERFNYRDPQREFPGAGAYAVKTDATGKQVLSGKQTLPQIKIGSSVRDAGKKMHISKGHERQMYGLGSPGPMTSVPQGSIGAQPLSRKKTNPSWGFGTSKRSTMGPADTPGPGAYFA